MRAVLIYTVIIFSSFVLQLPACLGELPIGYSNKVMNFGNDIVAHFDPDKSDLSNDISVAFNGWIYIAYSAVHSDPSGVDIGLIVSKDSGLTWQQFAPIISGSHNAASVYDLLVTGTDTNSLRVYLSYSYYDAAFSYPFGHIIVYDGLSGSFLPYGIDIGDGKYDIGDVRLSSDYLHPASGTIGYSVAVAYSTGHGDFTSTDSLVCMIASDTTKNTFAYNLLDSSSQVSLRGASIDYGFSLAWNKGIYYIAYQRGSKIAYCRNSATITTGFTSPIILNDLLGINDGELDSSKIVCQNSFNSNDSSGLSVMIVTKALDTAGTNTYRLPFIIYNMQSATTDFWSSTFIDNPTNGFSITTYDACFSETENRFYIGGYNADSASLFLRMEDFNFSHHGNWYSVESQYNDSILDPLLAPNPRIVSNNNSIYSSWESRIKGSSGLPRSQTLFDKLSLPIITSLGHVIKTTSYLIYPIPANNQLTIFKSGNLLNEKSIQIFDQLGRQVLFKTINSGIESFTIDTSDLSDGIYFLCIVEEKIVVESRKILINHF